MGNYNIPKNRKKKYSSKRVTVDNPFLKLIAGLIVFGLGVMLAGLIAANVLITSPSPAQKVVTIFGLSVFKFFIGGSDVK